MTRLGQVLSAAVLTAIVAVAGACGLRRAALPVPPLTVVAIEGPAASDPSGIQLTAAGARTILTWSEPAPTGATVKFSELLENGWSAPVVVVGGGDVLANPVDVPSVHALANGRLLAQWLERNGPDPEAYDLRIAWSSDGGRSWSPPLTPHDDGTRTQHGFASILAEPGGGFQMVWLDGRNRSSGLLGEMNLRAAAYDAAGALVRQSVVDPRVCECCQTSAAMAANGVLVAYRNRSDEEVRDIQVARFDGRSWTEPVTVHEDGWKIDGCPVNGPAISAQGSDVAVAWFSAPKVAGHAFVAFSDDGSRTFGRPVQLDDAPSSGRVQVAMLPDGTAAATWVEPGTSGHPFKVRQVRTDGGRSDATIVGHTTGRQYPRMVRAGNTLMFAWVERTAGMSRLLTARATF